MRRYRTGCFDHTTATWKLRSKGLNVSASTRKLGQVFGVELPKSESGSVAYWMRYLDQLHRETILSSYQRELNEAASLRGQLRRDAEAHAHAHYQPLIAPPQEKPATSAKDMLRTEIEAHINRHKAKAHKGWYDTKSALDLFFEATGDIPFREVDASRYRKFLELLDKQENWSERTRINRQRTVHTFLKRLEADYNVVFGFIRNPDYKRAEPEGCKVQFSLDQVKLALREAAGDVRFSLLMGLNCGFYWSDLGELKAEHIVTEEAAGDGPEAKPAMCHVEKSRAKLKGRSKPMVCSWLLWDETKAVLQLAPSDAKEAKRYQRRLWEHYDKFAQEHGLPEHKALRKSVAQWIQDGVSEEAARLYRGENVGGTHGKNYIKFSEAQRAKLDDALRFIHTYIFGCP